MKKNNLFQKTILPILLVMVIGFIPSFYLINKSITKTITKSTHKIIKNDTNYIKNTIELKYKILFFLSNKSEHSYINNSHISKRKIRELLMNYFVNKNKIIFIQTPNENIPASTIELTKNNMQKVINIKKEQITLNNNSYIIKSVNFEPFDWKIYYLYNLEEQNDIILNDQIIVIVTIGFFMLIVFVTLLLIFKNYVNRPNTILLNHFKDIANGTYNLIDTQFNVQELDLLVSNFNLITKDIEKRENKIKQNLKESENNSAYINNILNTQKNIIITKNANEEITSVNNAFFKFFSMFKDLDTFKQTHSTITDFFVEEKGFIYKFKNKSWIDEILNDQQATHRVKLDINGNIYFFTIDLVKSKKYGHTLITLTDITNLENQKAILDQYDKIINKSLMVSRTDLDGKILYVNNELLKTTKYKKEELIGRNENILRSPDTPIKFYEDMEKVVQKEKIWSGQVEKIDKDGNKFYVHLYLSPIMDANHKIIEYMYLRHNITDLITAQQKAKSAEQSKSIFLASMSHEIRTPLNAIIGFTKILASSNLKPKFKHYVTTIDKSAETLLSILNDILDISKIESNNLVLEKEPFNPIEEFNATINLFYAKFKDKQINVEYFIDPNIPQFLVGDALRIKQVLSNLISNAIKFTDEKGVIAIRAEIIRKNEETCDINFSIKDSGIGIPKDKQAHIFTPFAQADGSTTRVFGGTGLGLDICSKIVKLHNSNIILESQEGIGSKFSFTINFDIKEDNNVNTKIKKLKTCIIKFPSNNNEYINLKEYINSITKNIIINDSTNTELLKQQDLIFIHEKSIDNRIEKLSKNGLKFAIYSPNSNTKFNLKNYHIIPKISEVSQLFNVLVEIVNKNISIIKDNKDNKMKYKGSILIAEDHLINQELISILLTTKGIKPVLSNDGIEVIKNFKKEKFDLVLMDINMPNKNGIDATKSIRKYEKEQNLIKTPIVALTANALEENRKQMLEAGMDDHLLKPIDEKELNRVLNTYLESKPKKNKNKVIEKKLDKTKKTESIGIKKTKKRYTIEEASKSIGVGKDSIKKIVQNFAKNIDEDMNILQNTVDKQDFTGLSNISHKIKGATLNLKMTVAGELASKLEKNAHRQNSKKIKKIFEQFKKEIKYLKKYIQTL